MLVTVDSEISLSTPLPWKFSFKDECSGALNKKNNTYLVFQKNEAKKWYLAQFSIDNGTIDTFSYTGTLNDSFNNGSLLILYNTVLDKYFLTYDDYAIYDEHFLFELIFSGKSCKEKMVRGFDGIISPVVDELTGEIVFRDKYGTFYIYNQITGSVQTSAATVNIGGLMYALAYNNYDNAFCGVEYGASDEIWMLSPKTGIYRKIGDVPMNMLNHVNTKYSLCIDPCNKQCIIQHRSKYQDSVVLSWMDIKTGNIVKRRAIRDSFYIIGSIKE